jgi:choline dehydrogenase
MLVGAPRVPAAAVQRRRGYLLRESQSSLETPDLQTSQGEIPIPSIETAAQFPPPAKSWTMLAGVVRPKSRGQVYLSGPDPDDPMRIEANLLSHPDDIKAALACVELCREIANSQALRSFARREVMLRNLEGFELQNFIRDDAISYWHQSGTARMGRDAMSVVDGELRVYGLKNLRIADASIMPRVTTGNTSGTRCHWRARRRDAEDRPPDLRSCKSP